MRPLNLSEKERGDKNIIKLPANSNGAVGLVKLPPYKQKKIHLLSKLFSIV